jgi:hypothetical protein
MSRFVRPKTRTLTLENGDQLIVREQLTAGEQRAHFARVYTTAPDGRLSVNPLRIGIGVIVAYLLDWNLRDDHDQLVSIRDLSPDELERVIDSLDTESFAEIRAAIEAHDAAMLAARAEKKRTRVGELVS